MNGVDYHVMKAIIEFIYSGECVVAEDHLKFFMGAVRLLKISALENIFTENEYQHIAGISQIIFFRL